MKITPDWKITEAMEKLESLQRYYLPNALLAASDEPLSYPLFEHRYSADSTRIFICQFGQCLQPVEAVPDALEELEIGAKN